MIKAYFWLLWLKLADFCFKFKKEEVQEEVDTIDNYEAVYPKDGIFCSKCCLNIEGECIGAMFDQLTEKYGECVFTDDDKQHYYKRVK